MTGEMALEIIAGAVARAESDGHVPRAVTALERIATALETIALKPATVTLSQGALFRGVKSGVCVKCGATSGNLNAAGTCYSCFCAGTPG